MLDELDICFVVLSFDINWQISRFRDEKVPTLIQNRAREAQFYTEYEIMNKGL